MKMFPNNTDANYNKNQSIPENNLISNTIEEEINDSIEYWFYENGVNVIPFDSINKQTFIKWLQYPDSIISKKIFEQWIDNPQYKNIVFIDESDPDYFSNIEDNNLPIPVIIEDKKVRSHSRGKNFPKFHNISVMSKEHEQITEEVTEVIDSKRYRFSNCKSKFKQSKRR